MDIIYVILKGNVVYETTNIYFNMYGHLEFYDLEDNLRVLAPEYVARITSKI